MLVFGGKYQVVTIKKIDKLSFQLDTSLGIIIKLSWVQYVVGLMSIFVFQLLFVLYCIINLI